MTKEERTDNYIFRRLQANQRAANFALEWYEGGLRHFLVHNGVKLICPVRGDEDGVARMLTDRRPREDWWTIGYKYSLGTLADMILKGFTVVEPYPEYRRRILEARGVGTV